MTTALVTGGRAMVSSLMATATGDSDKRQAMAAMAAVIRAKTMMAGRAAKASMQERCQRSKGSDSSNGSKGREGILTATAITVMDDSDSKGQHQLETVMSDMQSQQWPQQLQQRL